MLHNQVWTQAKSTRKPLQTKLVPDNFQDIVSLRPCPTKTCQNLRDSQLGVYGFTRTRSTNILKRKGQSEDAYEVKDSQMDTDDYHSAWAPELPNVAELDPRDKENQATPKRRKLTVSDAPTCCSSDPIPTTPLVARLAMTPKRSRFIENDQSLSFSSPEVPSSLEYERYNFQAWLEDSPVKIRKVQGYKATADLLASPPTSSPVCAIIAKLIEEENITRPSKGLLWQRTPAGTTKQLHTPPPSRQGCALRRTTTPDSLAVDVLSDEYADDEGSVGGSKGDAGRPPLLDLDPELVLQPRTRAKRYADAMHITTTTTTSQAPAVHTPTSIVRASRLTVAREESAQEEEEEFYDARESLSPSVDEASLIQQLSEPDHLADLPFPEPSSPTSSRPTPAAAGGTVEDSQYPEMFAPLSSTSSSPQDASSSASPTAPPPTAMSTLPMTSGLPGPAASQKYSWEEEDNSLLDTFLPPGYHSSQFAVPTQDPEAGSACEGTCRPPPAHSWQDASSSQTRSPVKRTVRSSDDTTDDGSYVLKRPRLNCPTQSPSRRDD